MRLSSSVILGTCLISSSAALAGGEWEILISSLDPTVPGVPDAVWVPNTFNVPTIDENGNIAFRGQIGGADITLANSRLVLRGSPGNWSILAREGSPLPGDVIPGYVFNQTTGLNGLSSSTSMSANGGVIVSGFVNGPDVASTTDTAAVYVPADDLTTPYLIGREGDAYPGGGGAVM